MISVLLVDDQQHVRQGLRMFLTLDPDVRVVGEANDATAALALASDLHPGVVVMDLRMPGMDGIAATRILRNRHPDSRIVILSLYDDEANRSRAQRAGATGFVAKNEAPDVLVQTIHQSAARDRPL